MNGCAISNESLQPEEEMKAALPLVESGSGRVHLVGVCGVGMAGLAYLLSARGAHVSGCDIACSGLASWLERQGVQVISRHDSAHLRGVDWVVRSTAIRSDHPEIVAAAALGLPVLRRGAVLAALLTRYKSVIVSGTHGKTTAAAMTAQVLRACGASPSFCIGGESDLLGGVAGKGQGDFMVAEADESDGTLACYEPDIAIITNIEFDHSEYFDSLEALTRCFRTVAGKVKGKIIYCADDAGADGLCSRMGNAISYGFAECADLRASGYVETGSSCRFNVSLDGRGLGEVMLPVAGRHNVLNALSACAVALDGKARFSSIQKGLAGFQAVRRRFERIVENESIVVVSDYAHHPSEISALMKNAKGLGCSRLFAIFQPHRFSRTLAFASDFPAAFEGLDELILTPVYAASETPVEGGASWDLYARFRAHDKVKVLCASGLEQAWNYLRRELKKGDGLLIVGAGDVGRVGDWARTHFSGAGMESESRLAALKRLRLTETILSIDEPLAEKTTLRVGGRTDIFAAVRSEKDLIRILEWTAEQNIPLWIIGAGSNVLAGDLGFRGLVLRLDRGEFCRIYEDDDGCIVCGAAVTLNALTGRLAELGRSGLSFLCGIPGTVGGALRMNAGAWGSAIGERTAWVRVLNRDGRPEKIPKANLDFVYRGCDSLKGRVILEAAFIVEEGSASEIRNQLECIAKKREWMKGLRCAGSVFKNPRDDYAGSLISRAGLKGLRIGGARISERHGNLIVTEEGATASDVHALIEIVRNKVRVKSGVELVEEIMFLE